MRLYWHIGLPGPFSVGGPVGSGRTPHPHYTRTSVDHAARDRWHSPLYWLTGLALYELAFWVFAGAVVIALWLAAALVWGLSLGVASLVTWSTRPFRLWRKLPPLFKSRVTVVPAH